MWVANPSSDINTKKVGKSVMKLELVQYPYSKSGPTVYIDDRKIAGPKAYGVGRTVASYDVDEEVLKTIVKQLKIAE